MGFKIMSKLPANRLKGTWAISWNQTITISWEVDKNVIISLLPQKIQTMRTKRSNEFVATKVYMENTYDRLDWGFLEYTLQKFGIKRRIRWAPHELCIDSFNACILECKPHGNISSIRNMIRWSDPLRPLPICDSFGVRKQSKVAY